MKTKAILFDLGGVIVPLDGPEAMRRWKALGVDTDRYLGLYGQKGIFHDVETGHIDSATFLKKLSEMVGREVSHEEALHAWLGFIRPMPDERAEALEKLRGRYRLCLASNTNPFVMSYMRSPAFHHGKSIDDYFDSVYCSNELHAYKPDAEFFRRILAAEGLMPDEAVFVDDSAANIAGAEALGIKGILAEPDSDWLPELERVLRQQA